LNGYINVYSEEGHGTRFCIYLPLTDEVGVVLGADKDEADGLAGSETILVVEDEENVREMASELLEELGYSVIQAAVQKALAPIMPTLGAELVKVVQPAAEKAANTVGPVIDEKLREYGPWIGAIAGTVSAILSIIGMILVGGYVVKKVG